MKFDLSILAASILILDDQAATVQLLTRLLPDADLRACPTIG